MKKFSLMAAATALALVLAPAVSAWAEGGLYVTPKLGYSHVKGKLDLSGDEGDSESVSKSKNLVPFGLAVGYDLNPVRAELEYAFRGKKEFYSESGEDPDGPWSDKAKLGVQTLFLNAYYDIHNSSPITPYVGLGLGLAKQSYELAFDWEEDGESYSDKFSGSKNKFAWNIGAGAAYQLNDLMALDLGYRYANFGKISEELVEGFDMDVKSSTHEVLLGLRFTF